VSTAPLCSCPTPGVADLILVPATLTPVTAPSSHRTDRPGLNRFRNRCATPSVQAVIACCPWSTSTFPTTSSPRRPSVTAAVMVNGSRSSAPSACVHHRRVCRRTSCLTADHVQGLRQFYRRPIRHLPRPLIQRSSDSGSSHRSVRSPPGGPPAPSTRATAPKTTRDRQVLGRRSGQRGRHAAQHLHGGVGSTASYPTARYFGWANTPILTFCGGQPPISWHSAAHGLRIRNPMFCWANSR